MKQIGIYQITYELLGKFLNLDEDHKVIDVLSSHVERKRNLIGVKVSGPCMPQNPEGQEIQWVPLDQIEYVKKFR